MVCSNEHTEDIDFFLGEDIIQGENIPFYLLWKGADPKEITLELSGFKSIVELHNAIKSRTVVKEGKTVVSGFYVPGYLGGLLSTEITNIPINYGSLTLNILEKNGSIKSLNAIREMYTTRLDLKEFPEDISIGDSKVENKISIELKGNTTVFLGIEEMEKNECEIDIPSEVKAIFIKFYESIQKGVNELKEDFPEHQETLELFLVIPDTKVSVTQFIEKYGEKIKESFKDEIFLDAFSTIFITALFEQVGIEDRILKPLNEYFESNADDKAYFLNPLLQIRVPAGGCLMAIKIKANDLLKQESNEVEIKVPLKANEETYKPLKDLFLITRNIYE